MLETERMVQEHKDRGALWVSMRERGDDGVGVLKASSTAVCCSTQPPLTVQHTLQTLLLFLCLSYSCVLLCDIHDSFNHTRAVHQKYYSCPLRASLKLMRCRGQS